MAWFDRNDAKVPDSLRNLTPEQLEAAVKFYETNKDKVGQLETELNTTKTSLETTNNEFTTTKNRLAELEVNFRKIQDQNTPTAPVAPTQPVDFFTDPEVAYRQRTQPLVDFTMATAATTAKMAFENWVRDNPGPFKDDMKIYKRYYNEVTSLMSREPPINQSNPQAWYNAFTLIKGNHDGDIHKARIANDAVFFGEEPTVHPTAEPDKSKEITDQDKKDAERFRVTPEQVAASRNLLTYEKVGN